MIDVKTSVPKVRVRGDIPCHQPSKQSGETPLPQVQPRNMPQCGGEVNLPDETQRVHTPPAANETDSQSPQRFSLSLFKPPAGERYSVKIERRGLKIMEISYGSLIIRVACPSLEILENLWSDHKSGRLEKEAESCLVTEDFLREFNLKEVKLRVEISEEEYKACRHELMKQGEKFRMKNKIEHLFILIPSNCSSLLGVYYSHKQTSLID